MPDRVWDLASTERRSFADFAESLSPAELDTQSLCAQWRVRDVIAHVSWAATNPPLATLRAIAGARFRANVANARLGREWGERPPEQTLAHLRQVADHHARTVGTKPVDVLADVLTHHLDIRVPLGRRRTPPGAGYRMALTRYAGMGFPLHLAFGRSPKGTAAGFTLVADDVDWRHGTGPQVHAPGDAMLLALTGRPVDPVEFTGAGAEEFVARLEA
ncbi:maleylpyruvate isomerase family mycothiol-dependent enzyme [Nocardioides sp. JQ2195]|uniref:maleylpyruvate isomerase family mycothiol-dependent enzyme n=1 Tax=Nocardioides sp. JQ2195 TaxID=2592334 RepID=UPI00143E7CC4|nr:maleylpyruvate isomerase family mycothiol-dependent enzyme [Nocardioides sp. JQ2195]QIX27704.1 maleylpyruvate isomerase family mycothiol-dependent enzyme [Nocardioides sp. JQ2195]